METIFCRIMKIFIIAIVASLAEFISAEVLTATTIEEPPYVKLTKDTPTSNKDFEGYIPDLLEKLANQSECNCKFDLKLVADGTYGIKEGEKWSGMIGEILDEEAVLVAAPLTHSEERAKAISFLNEHLMTFDTVVLMKKTPAMKRINSPTELAERKDIKYGLVKAGFTENFFKKSENRFYRDMYAKMEKNLPQNSKEGVDRVKASDGKYAFMIDSSTAEYWVSKKPCDLYSFRLGSSLGCHKYAFAVRKGQGVLKARLERAIRELMSSGELERLKAKWWPHECSAAAAAFDMAQLSVLLVSLTSITALRLI